MSTAADRRLMRPYYVLMRLPGEADETFVLILPFTPLDRQTLCFSATMPLAVEKLVRQHLVRPMRVEVGVIASWPLAIPLAETP